MKVLEVSTNKRKRSFAIRTAERAYVFPFAKLSLPPTRDDPIEEVFVDPDIASEGFTYRLRSGVGDTIHLDTVRELALDPDLLQELFLYELTVAARCGLEESGLGKRQAARLLGTSPSQLYRLLDPTNSSKSVGQMLALLRLVGRDVRVEVVEREGRGESSGVSFS